MFTQQIALDLPALAAGLSALFPGTRPEDVTADFLNSGSTGRAFRVLLAGSPPRELALKAVGEDTFLEPLYREALEPFGLASPRLLGTVAVAGEAYLVSEFVPHQPIDWHDEAKALRAIRWLAAKDRAVGPHVAELAAHAFAQQHYPTEAYVDRAVAAHAAMAEKLVGDDFIDALDRGRQAFRDADALLLGGTLTLCHNDFATSNVLYATDGELYVIDWTRPSVGSVAIDLAKHVTMDPPEMRERVIAAYREAFGDIPDFDAHMEAGTMRATMSYFAWMLEVALRGEGHVINMFSFAECRERIAGWVAGARQESRVASTTPIPVPLSS